ncbi:hypothetical protein [Halobaculum marinum]|uniref:Uncharacterized protein n=1 Tax=Halobaculum marinum TaxID=3031996 RepID=A0ABD5WW59_9EURY|nr:hypothetical protein [Halobaculum sp. DT55]
MSSGPRDSNPDATQDDSNQTDDAAQGGDVAESPGMTIPLPEGSTSVSDAIVTNREMLRDPENHGLATDGDIENLSGAMESLSAKVERVNHQHEDGAARLTELEELAERQQQQIDELQSMVSSLVDILGTEAEWTTFDEE